MTSRPSRVRLVALAVGLALGAFVLGLRLYDLQIRRGADFRARAQDQRENVHALAPRRGDILDRNGRELAVSVSGHAVGVRPAQVVDPAATARRLAALLDLPIAEVSGRLRGGRRFTYLRRQITPTQARAVAAADLKGVVLEPTMWRVYPNRALAAHALGYVGIDGQALAGAERAFDEHIRGSDGRAVDLVDAGGAPFGREVLSAAVPGLDLELTLDLRLQHVLEEELDYAVRTARARAGAAAVLDPATGEVLALASWPTFNPNTFNTSTDDERLDRVLVHAYEPGSTFKIVTAAAALERGLVRPGEVMHCGDGRFQIGRYTIRDHKKFGALTFTEVMAESSNVGAMKVGLRVPPQEFYSTIQRFGFGEKTGLALGGEHPGLLRPPAQWSLLSQPSLSMGQEVMVTPMQILSAMAAVGNGGVRIRPWLAAALRDDEGRIVRRFEPPAPTRVLDAGVAATLTGMLESVVRDGTGVAASAPGYTIAGKTGTAQKAGPKGGYIAGLHVASFAGFAPAHQPRLAAVFVVDEPNTPHFHGGDIAAPAFGRFMARVLPVLGVPPDNLRDDLPGADRLVLRRRGSGAAEDAVFSILHRTDRNVPEPDAEEIAPAALPAPEPLVVAAATTSPTVPDLRGLTSREAIARLTHLGVAPRLFGLGRVTTQDPPPGTPLPLGDAPCRLWLASPVAP